VQEEQIRRIGIEPLDDAWPLIGGAAMDVTLFAQVDAACRAGVFAATQGVRPGRGIGDVKDHRLVGLHTVQIDVFTIFPGLVDTFCTEGLLGRARANELLDLRTHDLRDHTTDVHRTVDDAPFGGGAGMVMKAEPIFASVEAVDPPRPLFLLGPAGRLFDQQIAEELAALEGFSLLCGRYEGIDHRVREHLVDGELSIGDVVLGGGEVAACLVIEAVARLLPGAMGNDVSPITESFGASGLLEEPHYTRPAEFRGWAVPETLRGGDHARIERWRRAQALHRTLRYRPDLVEAAGGLREVDRRLLEEFPPVTYP
jgi:tRNA (guanine37-N1)-methyltransferase